MVLVTVSFQEPIKRLFEGVKHRGADAAPLAGGIVTEGLTFSR